jgi:acyl-CoA synthetase
MTSSSLNAAYDAQTVRTYTEQGYWGSRSITDIVRANVTANPGGAAFIAPGQHLTWSDYEEQSTRMAVGLMETGIQPGDRVGVFLPDTPTTHVMYLSLEKAGAVVVGIGIRSGSRELEHVLRTARALAIITPAQYRDADYADLFQRLRQAVPTLRRHVVVGGSLIGSENADEWLGVTPTEEQRALVERRRLGPNDLFMINSTSGTTGLPKCVRHSQNRWVQFTRWSVEAARLGPAEVFFSVVPSPYGFGLWTAHFTPTELGAPCVLVDRPSPVDILAAIQRERVTVLAAVTTQFIQMLNDPTFGDHDLSSLRALFTGGEAVPYQRAREFEDRTNCAVLQFYGSNETGALSYTSFADTQDRRLRTSGRIIPEMQVRLFDQKRHEVTGTVGIGQPGCKGPSVCSGYLDDSRADAEMFTSEGWALTGDLVEIDVEGYLSVVGRVADIIIRGGANISAARIEEDICSHPAVAIAAVVGMPDPVFGEKVCAYVELRPGQALSLAELCDHLVRRGVSRHTLPERLEVLDRMPITSGEKVAKSELRAEIRRKLGTEQERSVG